MVAFTVVAPTHHLLGVVAQALRQQVGEEFQGEENRGAGNHVVAK